MTCLFQQIILKKLFFCCCKYALFKAEGVGLMWLPNTVTCDLFLFIAERCLDSVVVKERYCLCERLGSLYRTQYSFPSFHLKTLAPNSVVNLFIKTRCNCTDFH